MNVDAECRGCCGDRLQFAPDKIQDNLCGFSACSIECVLSRSFNSILRLKRHILKADLYDYR